MEQLESRLLPSTILPDTALVAPASHFNAEDVAQLQQILTESIGPVITTGENLDVAMFRLYGYTLLYDVRIDPVNSDHIQLTIDFPGLTWWETTDGGQTWTVMSRGEELVQPQVQPLLPDTQDVAQLLPAQQSDQFQPCHTTGADWLPLTDEDWSSWQETVPIK